MLKIKEEYLDVVMSSPFDKRTVILRFLDRGEYIHWFNKLPHLFEENKFKKKYVELKSRN